MAPTLSKCHAAHHLPHPNNTSVICTNFDAFWCKVEKSRVPKVEVLEQLLREAPIVAVGEAHVGPADVGDIRDLATKLRCHVFLAVRSKEGLQLRQWAREHDQYDLESAASRGGVALFVRWDWACRYELQHYIVEEYFQQILDI